jgi:hypothetical protein
VGGFAGVSCEIEQPASRIRGDPTEVRTTSHY